MHPPTTQAAPSLPRSDPRLKCARAKKCDCDDLTLAGTRPTVGFAHRPDRGLDCFERGAGSHPDPLVGTTPLTITARTPPPAPFRSGARIAHSGSAAANHSLTPTSLAVNAVMHSSGTVSRSLEAPAGNR